MKNKIYINGMGSISAQDNDEILKGNVIQYDRNIFPAIDPDYKDYISSMALRRMSKGVKMALTAAKMALEESAISLPDAIITGTGQGCKIDTEKFLEDMIGQNESLLSPTSFIQSTHNTIGGQIALNLNCNSYNVTYSQNSSSLESALIDSGLYFQEAKKPLTILAGGVDEISPTITNFSYLDGQLKKEEIVNTRLFEHNTAGTITSEGAHFFLFSSEKTKTTYSSLTDVEVFHTNSSSQVVRCIQEVIKKNVLNFQDLDLVILGNNGDSSYDHYYHELQNGIFKDIPQLCYKHLVGDYNTVSGFAIWLGSNMLKTGTPPGYMKDKTKSAKRLRNILIYNHYLGENHSVILLQAP